MGCWRMADRRGPANTCPRRRNYLLNTVVTRNTTTASNWADFQNYVDAKQFAEYLVVSWYQGQTDWPDNN